MANPISTTSNIQIIPLAHQVIHELFDDGLSMVKLNQANFNCFLIRGTR